MNNPKVSIITVSYNAEKTIEQTIQSVLNQSYDNIEYIIIDGKSTDGTCEIIKKYQNRVCAFISEADNGIYDAMNKGIAYATGEIIGIINSDDWYEEDTIEKVVKAFCTSETDAVYGRCRMIMNGTSRIMQDQTIEDIWTGMIPHPTVFVKRNLYEKYGVFDTKYRIAADYDLILRFYTNGAKFKRMDEILANFRYGGVSTTATRECQDESYGIVLQYLDKSPDKEKYSQILEEKRKVNEAVWKIWHEPGCLKGILSKKLGGIEEGIVVFGTGIWGERVVEIAERDGITIQYFVDNNCSKWGEYLGNYLIKDPETLQHGVAKILVAIRKHDEEIEKQLRKYGNPEVQWISMDGIVGTVEEK